MNALTLSLLVFALVGWLHACHLADQKAIADQDSARLRTQRDDALQTVSRQAQTISGYRQCARRQITILDTDGSIAHPYVPKINRYSVN